MGSDVVSRDLAITEDRNEVIHHVIGESPPINGIRDWFVGIVEKMSGNRVCATRVACSGVYPPACSSECAKTAIKRASSVGSPARYSAFFSPVRIRICKPTPAQIA